MAIDLNKLLVALGFASEFAPDALQASIWLEARGVGWLKWIAHGVAAAAFILASLPRIIPKARRMLSAFNLATAPGAIAPIPIPAADTAPTSADMPGKVLLCFNLPRSVQGRDVWDVAGDDGGTWGGHLVWANATNRVNSWGQQILVTPAFIEQYAFDAIAVVSADAIKPDGRAFSGLDLGGLREALAEVTG